MGDPGNNALTSREREAALARVLERSRVVVFVWRITPEFPVEFVSENVSQFGYSADDFLSGRVRWPAITHPADDARLRDEVARYLESGVRTFDQHYRIIDADGKLRHIEDHTTAIVGSNGVPTHFEGIVIDVTESRRQQREIEAQRRWQERLLEVAADGIIICDRKGTIVDANPAAVSLSGYPCEVLVGRTLADFVSEDEASAKPFEIDTVMAGQTVRNERRMQCADGREIVIETSAHRIDDLHFMAILRDVTERVRRTEALTHSRGRLEKQVRERTTALYSTQEYLKTVVGTSDDGILVVDAEGRFEFGNGATYRIFDRAPNNLLGRNFVEVVAEDMHDFIMDRWSEVQAGRGEPYEVDIITGGGARRTLQVSHRHMDVGRQRKYCVVVRDITAQKREAAELQRHRERLEQIVSERTRKLREVNATLRREVKARREAEAELVDTANKLRRLSTVNEQIIEDEHRRIAREIHDELGQIMTAVQLDLHWLERHVTDPDCRERCTDLTGLTKEAIRSIQSIVAALRPPLLEDEGLEAAVEWHLEHFAQRTNLAVRKVISLPEAVPPKLELIAFRVIQEALNNVVRHAQATQVQVRLEVKHDRLRVEVSDNGLGLDENATRRPNGTGLLGMRERVREAGGTFSVARAGRKGTRVRATLPLGGN